MRVGALSRFDCCERCVDCCVWHTHSNAGKFTTTGIVTVSAVVIEAADESLPPLPDGQPVTKPYLCLTVTNPCQGKGIADPESLFVPFRGTFEGNAAVATGR